MGWAMAQQVCVVVSAAEREQLMAEVDPERETAGAGS